APLTLVQSLAAGGIGVLALVSARMSRRALPRREAVGVVVSIVGLVALAVSLAGGAGEGIAGGLFFSIGDISVKVSTEGGARAAFGISVLLGYGLGTALLQLGYRHG